MHVPEEDRLRPVLSDVDYPCGRAELVHQAAAHGADDDILGHLAGLPEGDYTCFEAVTGALAETV
ncbi:DUF2795 domain-containing protein [Amycolatopsis cynarae]|uniref:DUF2795 domain-containing protein n=2 Tax=Amycolatopsis TaxID=1813 RepID=A0A558AWF8_9PSEU|nr:MULTISPECIES: DUF2795 domain-containing protein [Amycolatopsis]TVT28583.1 DUF2795 domain-containing protein [Amycolatopsis rhizosphaerae]WAL67500.1 DUF2795 domain-containing protein [Amycolatopsis sp. HUAS 11-8]